MSGLGILLMLGGGTLVHRWYTRVYPRIRARRDARRVAANGQHQAAIRRQRQASIRQRRAAHLQTLLVRSLRQLSTAPDFRRVTSMVENCHDVPIGTRQRLFQAHRRHFIRHFGRCLQHGRDADQLLGEARMLVEALGVAPFEADYIADEARQRWSRRTPSPPAGPQTFARRIEQLQQELQNRLQAIRANVHDEELQEQLIEAEESRFRDQLLEIQNSPPRGQA